MYCSPPATAYVSNSSAASPSLKSLPSLQSKSLMLLVHLKTPRKSASFAILENILISFGINLFRSGNAFLLPPALKIQYPPISYSSLKDGVYCRIHSCLDPFSKHKN